jgi:dipeptidase D
MAGPFPSGLEPALLWKHFDLLRSIPRGSGHEAAVREAVAAGARDRGFMAETDQAGNLLIRVPATPGREHVGTTILQGHLDIVWEKNADVAFDFETQGLEVRMDGEFLTAVGTTLGADNGIGVAAALALAEDPTAVHGPLELLFTVDEETGMTGAFGLEAGFLTGRRMLNLDTEEEGAVYVGCAGGGDVNARYPAVRDLLPAGGVCCRLEIKGLIGGHSGLEIHENRCNAIKALGRVLGAALAEGVPVKLTRIDGGSKRNAIPREAGCGLCIPAAEVPRMAAIAARMSLELVAEFGRTDPDLTVTFEERPACTCTGAFAGDLTPRLVHAILATPSSVLAMSRDVPGLVETSNNLGVIRTDDDEVVLVHCSRSSRASALEAVRASLKALHGLAGASVVLDPSYPGWQPDLASPLLKTALQVHQTVVGRAAEVKAVHAGLECGLIGEKYPGLDMISIGPTMYGVHSPAERVSVPSVGRFYAYLKAVLAELG